MKKTILITCLFAGMIAILASCSGEHPGFKKTTTGIFYKIHIDNPDGEKAQVGDILDLDMVYRTEDSVFFDSRLNPQRMTLPLSEKQYDGDIYEALLLLKAGDSATFILDAEAFFTKTVGMPELPTGLEPGDKMYFDIKLNSNLTEQEMQQQRTELQESRKELEPQELEQYLELNKITNPPTESGYYYIEHQKGSGNMVKVGDRIKAHFFISTITGAELYSTYDAGEPIEVEVGRMFDNEGVTEALSKVRLGTKATIIVPSQLAFGAEGRGDVVPPYTTMVYDVEVVELITKDQFEKEQNQKEKDMQRAADERKTNEKASIQNYLKANNITVEPTASGLYYIEKETGNGPKPESGQTVSVHYTGTLLNGSKFDSSVDRGQPFEFTLGAGQVIRGWDEGIALMNVGSKALLVIPSELGYGSRDMGDRIPSFSTLVFEVELLGIK